MASTMSAPSTPTPRRSNSLPANAPSSPDPQIEVLLNLPSARIIAFTTANSTSRRGSTNESPAVEEEPGTLAWCSRFERTIAIGPLRIYRAPGSVAFLNCSNALRPILPKSQCWEVDGSGKFVLQIRRPQYWRIEVPSRSSVEVMQMEELKEVLTKVLLFERTPCPFSRDFTVEIPDAPKTPVKKRPWKPVERPEIDITPPTTAINQASGTTRVSHLTLDAEATTPVTPRPVDTIGAKTVRSSSGVDGSGNMCSSTCSSSSFSEESSLDDPTPTDSSFKREFSSTPVPVPSRNLNGYKTENHHVQGDGDAFKEATDDCLNTPRSILQPAFLSMTLEIEKESRPQALQNCGRSITAPPVLSLITSPPSKHRGKSSIASTALGESDSDFSSSVDSFHSVQSWHSPLAPPSPPASGSTSPTSTYPYPHNNIVLPKRPIHSRDASELTVTPDTPQVWEMSPILDMDIRSRKIPPPPRTPTLRADGSERSIEEIFDVVTPPNTGPSIRHRATTSSNSRRRTLSPLPAAVNLFSPPRRRSRRLQTARHLPTAIIQKTCEILLSPPSHLLQLMLSIASKIAAGEWRGVLSGHGEAVHWDFEDEYNEGWHEDDYGISLGPTTGQANKRKGNIPGGSWELD